MRTVFIVNATAGNGRSGRLWAKLENRAKQLFGDGTGIVFTGKPGDATLLCRDALASAAARIIAVGGDGTLNEVLNGFFSDKGPSETAATLGTLPLGTGCDFARSISMNAKPALSLERLALAKPQPTDIGMVRYPGSDQVMSVRYFLNIADFGLGGAVAERIRHTKKRYGAMASYLISILRTLSSYRNPTIELELEGHVARTAVLNSVIAANGQYFGAGLRIAPNARIDDGMFDVVLLKDLGLLDVVRNLARARNGNHLGHPLVEVLRTRRLQARSPDKVAIDIDGEFVGFLPLEMTVLPGAVSVLRL